MLCVLCTRCPHVPCAMHGGGKHSAVQCSAVQSSTVRCTTECPGSLIRPLSPASYWLAGARSQLSHRQLPLPRMPNKRSNDYHNANPLIGVRARSRSQPPPAAPRPRFLPAAAAPADAAAPPAAAAAASTAFVTVRSRLFGRSGGVAPPAGVTPPGLGTAGPRPAARKLCEPSEPPARTATTRQSAHLQPTLPARGCWSRRSASLSPSSPPPLPLLSPSSPSWLSGHLSGPSLREGAKPFPPGVITRYATCVCIALRCPALPGPARPCPALRCPALPCAALPCPALPCRTLRLCGAVHQPTRHHQQTTLPHWDCPGRDSASAQPPPRCIRAGVLRFHRSSNRAQRAEPYVTVLSRSTTDEAQWEWRYTQRDGGAHTVHPPHTHSVTQTHAPGVTNVQSCKAAVAAEGERSIAPVPSTVSYPTIHYTIFIPVFGAAAMQPPAGLSPGGPRSSHLP
jgi:hypothetical protein